MASVATPLIGENVELADVGTGLGLATVMGVVRRLRGQATIESQLGQGTTIRVSIPAA